SCDGFNLYFNSITMFSIRASRRLLRASKPIPFSTKQTLRLPSASVPVRYASIKHTTNFQPPSREDLIELRERVQEFTSMRCHLITIITTLVAYYIVPKHRKGDTRRICRQSGQRQ